MRLGLHALGIATGARREVVDAVAAGAEAAGFATLWAGEHVVMVDDGVSRPSVERDVLIGRPLRPGLPWGDERTMKRFAELSGPLTPEAMERDASAYVDFLAAQGVVRQGAMGVVGYCFSGSMAMRTAAVRPQTIAAAASFHGGKIGRAHV